jgi:tRNASer (uridine44-2'-O)-methyltransferase
MVFQPQEIPLGSPPFFQEEAANRNWVPLYSHACSFGPDVFAEKMMNLIKNPNLNSSWLFRADILHDETGEKRVAESSSNDRGSATTAAATSDSGTTTSSSAADADTDADTNANTNANADAHLLDTQASGSSSRHAHTHTPGVSPIAVPIRGMTLARTLVRRLIPRNERRDKPLDQTCAFYTTAQDGLQVNPAATVAAAATAASAVPLSSLVIYMPHSPSADSLPFYHPKVQGIAHLHQWNETSDSGQAEGTISVHFLPYPEHPVTESRLQRTAYHLLEILDKHGHGAVKGYVKRVNHDVVIPQDRFQNRYALLKSKYARQMVDSWAEKTDPSKHVFEDLGIAAFLIELWSDMYPKDTTAFPGFVDIGCGNGLLVALLTLEGYSGWGFDARERKSWAQYRTRGHASPSGFSLEERLLLPAVVSTSGQAKAGEPPEAESELLRDGVIHDGAFPPGTFIISNHADELTPWTPILAASSRCPFIMIPCCSHNLTGEKFRAPPPRDKSKARSTYASLVDWVSRIAEDCGWTVETEMLRIPSTRNTCLLGRTRTRADEGEGKEEEEEEEEEVQVDLEALVEKYGGTGGYYENVVKLMKSGPRGH